MEIKDDTTKILTLSQLEYWAMEGIAEGAKELAIIASHEMISDFLVSCGNCNRIKFRKTTHNTWQPIYITSKCTTIKFILNWADDRNWIKING